MKDGGHQGIEPEEDAPSVQHYLVPVERSNWSIGGITRTDSAEVATAARETMCCDVCEDAGLGS